MRRCDVCGMPAAQGSRLCAECERKRRAARKKELREQKRAETREALAGERSLYGRKCPQKSLRAVVHELVLLNEKRHRQGLPALSYGVYISKGGGA